MYKVKNLTGLPSAVVADKTHILWVTAIGEIGNPEVINYQLIDQNGSVYNKTIVGAIESGWSNGGTSLQTTINKITNELGTLTSLKTVAKTSAVVAINELYTDHNSLKNSFTAHKIDYTTFKDHNHDTRYLRTDTPSILKSSIDVEGNGGLNIKRSNGSKENLIKATSSGAIEVGNANSALNLYGANNLLHNGKKIWTEVNDGAGSGLDADKLDGFESTEFARKSTPNTFTGAQTFGGGINLSNSSITWGSGKINFGATSTIFTHSNKNMLSIGSNGSLTFPTAELIANYTGGTEAKINFKLSSGEKGIGFTRSNGDSSLRLFNYNVGASGAEVFKVDADDSVVKFGREVQISGRKLYLQTATPTGTIPEGSIWIY